LAHREWVLMYQRGVRVDQIARANQRNSAYVLRYLVAVYGRTFELFEAKPRRVLVYDRPRPRPDTWPDLDRRFKVRLAELQAIFDEHGRSPHHGVHSTPEGRLTHWLNVQRSHDRKGILPRYRIRWLTEALPDWRTNARVQKYET